jgi:hypothetical protein
MGMNFPGFYVVVLSVAFSGCNTMSREIHGPEFEPSTTSLFAEAGMTMGGGKNHGWYFFGNSLLNSADASTLLQVQARSSSSSPAVQEWPRASDSLL